MQARTSLSLTLALVLAGGLAACSSDDTPDSGGVTDTGGGNLDATTNADATTNRDATTTDTGGMDAGVTDTGAGDAGTPAPTHVATLSGAQENPPVRDSATGTAEFVLNGMSLSYRITNNVAAPTAAHIHRGAVGVNGPVVFPLMPLSANMTGDIALTAQDVTDLQAGRLYVNFHNAMFPGGVIRGQILKPGEKAYVAQLNPFEENPPTNTPVRGTFSAILNAAENSLRFELVSTATPTAQHIHKAMAGVNGPVLYPLPLGRSVSGDQALTAQDVMDLKAGLLYANVHSAAFPGGEVRGQILKPGDRVYTANLTPGQETPPANATTTGRGMLIAEYANNRVNWYVTTTATPSAAHIHTAPAGSAGPVLIPFTQLGRIMSGTATTASTDGLGRGLWYFNVHTAANPAGEIRGQILRPGEQLFVAVMNGANEAPNPVNTTATGSVQFVLNQAGSSLHYEGVLMGLTATMAHIHAGAVGVAGGVVYPLTINGDRLGGDIAITMADLTPLRNQGWYANVHTAANPGGEIRGQIVAAQ